MLVDRGELSRTKSGERVYETRHLRKALLHSLFETIEAVVEIGFLHMREVYHNAPPAQARECGKFGNVV